ncbi:hypothetical protein NOR51B_977 [Luminiphilus syltensis NOR5-1B]|uniref:Uncharacterized protein n=1 Tax=Luminiphilus syltensis NOR5-1B TaxID=565045 RepID=B8KQE4_9GAMM|nr:putative 2OG-Fe(II) oxygenase [Luminiphilus syltensis]EED35036.1 hypothetical protein NOR51B_977 [Luminiphilus syltensis NOR5-1B]
MIQSDRKHPEASKWQTLADEDLEAAEARYAALLASDPQSAEAKLGLGRVLQQQGFQRPAMGLFQSVLDDDAKHVGALVGLGLSLKAMGWNDAAADTLVEAVRAQPDDGKVWGHLASAYSASGREDEAVAAYQEALLLAPDDLELHAWFNRYLGVLGHDDFLKSYRDRLVIQPDDQACASELARLLIAGGCPDEALAVLTEHVDAESASPATGVLRVEALRELGQFDSSLEAARTGLRHFPQHRDVKLAFAIALMASGADYGEAEALLGSMAKAAPDDQEVIAHYLTALRYTGSDRYRGWVDYARIVHPSTLIASEGCADLDTLVTRLRALHTTTQHPVEQSVVNGTQTLDALFQRQDDDIIAFVEVLGASIAEQLGRLAATIASRRLSHESSAFRFTDSWSVRLANGGFHKNHYHPSGWVSGVCYLTVPEEVVRQGRGWLKFGEPGFRAREPLEADFWIKPKPGMMVLFPSYLWHGTAPLCEPSERITVGFDLVPATH